MNDCNPILSHQLLAKVNEYISQSIDLAEILPPILQAVKQYLNCEQVFICHFNSEGQEEIINYLGYQPNLDEFKNNIINNCLGAKQLINLPKDQKNYSARSVKISDTKPILKSELSIPLLISIPEILVFLSDELWGILFAYDYDQSRVWKNEEIITIKQLTQQIVLAIERELVYEQLQIKNKQIQEDKVLDDLTQLANYQSFIDCLAFEWLRLAREKQPLSLILITVALCNHNNLELILQNIAEVLRKVVQRPSDLSSRYNEKKLAVILPNTNDLGGIAVANKIKEALQPSLNNNQDIIIDMVVTTHIPQPKTEPNIILELIENTLTKANFRGINIYVLKDNETQDTENRKEL
jgi:diguanylate cyclase (GGDEF)-like protein